MNTTPHLGKSSPYPGKEEDLQAATNVWLKLQHPRIYPLAFHTPNGGKRPTSTVRRKDGQFVKVPIIAAKLKSQGAKAGVPDWLILYPANGYHGAAIELKSKGGTLQETQTNFLQNLHQNGYYTAVAYNLQAFQEAINQYLTPQFPIS